MAEITKEDVIEFIANMSVLELSELVKEMEEKFGVSAAAPVAMMAAGPVDAGLIKSHQQNQHSSNQRKTHNQQHINYPPQVVARVHQS